LQRNSFGFSATVELLSDLTVLIVDTPVRIKSRTPTWQPLSRLALLAAAARIILRSNSLALTFIGFTQKIDVTKYVVSWLISHHLEKYLTTNINYWRVVFVADNRL
jgi:hypothetical protein